MRRLLCMGIGLVILAGCSSLKPVITEIRTDMVKVRLDVGNMSQGAASFRKNPQRHAAYASIVAEAQKGCDLHNRQAVEISWGPNDQPGDYYVSYEFLFACVERQETGEGE